MAQPSGSVVGTLGAVRLAFEDLADVRLGLELVFAAFGALPTRPTGFCTRPLHPLGLTPLHCLVVITGGFILDGRCQHRCFLDVRLWKELPPPVTPSAGACLMTHSDHVLASTWLVLLVELTAGLKLKLHSFLFIHCLYIWFGISLAIKACDRLWSICFFILCLPKLRRRRRVADGFEKVRRRLRVAPLGFPCSKSCST